VNRILAPLASVVLAAASLSAADTNALRKAPELAFNVPGQGQKLLSQYRGKVVALSFIWTTCPHCQAESKLLTKLQQEYGPRGFQAIDVAVNDNADLKVENFAKEFQVNFPVGWALKDEMIAFMGWSSAYYVVPQMVLVDRKGYIHYQTPQRQDENWDKLMKEDAVRQHIEELLSQNASASRSRSATSRVALAKKSS
jgi:thiol-disulfide isomerase/thioredoxin